MQAFITVQMRASPCSTSEAGRTAISFSRFIPATESPVSRDMASIEAALSNGYGHCAKSLAVTVGASRSAAVMTKPPPME